MTLIEEREAIMRAKSEIDVVLELIGNNPVLLNISNSLDVYLDHIEMEIEKLKEKI